MEEEGENEGDSGVELRGTKPLESSELSQNLARLRHDDVERLTDFVERDFDRIRYLVEALCGPQIDVEAAVSEATARALELLLRGRAIHHLPAWIAQTALNLGRSELRHHSVRRRSAGAIAMRNVPSEGIDDLTARRLDVRSALARLPRRQAQVIALYYGLDLPLAEIARTLGRSEGTVKANLFKARSALAANLGAIEGEDDGSA
jgi:RNA polymerase sigma-70 factor (ECF subfamily)